MKKIMLALAILCSFAIKAQNINIVPTPTMVKIQKGNFVLSNKTVLIVANKADNNSAEFLNNYLKKYYGFELKTATSAANNFINITTPTFIKKPDNEEHYTLTVSSKSIQIQGDGLAGTFYGIQSLIQLLPVQATQKLKPVILNLPCINIEDEPRFAYRGMHLDVSRHFFPIDYVKKYIDYIALHKMNYFHWHLTDDQGWRIEIKKYPKLTEIGAWREGTIIGRFPGTGNDKTKHGGYYTQEEIKDVISYAANRHITVLPEIEMPGHSMAVLAAYPELSTTPGITAKVPMTWGLNGTENNVFAPTEKTFKFLEDVLTEVMDLFPGKMIHIGGDECSKRWWKADSLSQQLMKANNLKTEDELQSYFIQRMEKFVNSKEKMIIGWDEILEGGLAPNAAVMSWTGEQGGIHAAKAKHNVVMTPGGWCYFDHTQTKQEDSVTIGGFTSLEKVYSYEPIPKELNADEAKYILGAQANLWTEYIAYPSKIEYMLFPRMSALSEVLWSKKENRNWESFEKRLPTQIKRYELWEANYSNAYYEIQSSVLPAENNEGLYWNLTSKLKDGVIKYRDANDKDDIGVSDYFIYKNKIKLTKGSKYEAVLIGNNKKISNSLFQTFSFNKATGKKITITPAPSTSYPGDGAFTLVNGIQNTKGRDRNGEFIGYSGINAEIIIDLGTAQNVSSVILHAFESQPSWIYRPSAVEVSLSTNAVDYTSFNSSNYFKLLNGGNGIFTVEGNIREARYLKIVVRNFGKIPDGKPGSGKGAWMFLDEIEVK